MTLPSNFYSHLRVSLKLIFHLINLKISGVMQWYNKQSSRTKIMSFITAIFWFCLTVIGHAIAFETITTNNSLTPWRWFILEKPLVAQLLKNIPMFYKTRKSITAFTRAPHWSTPSARLIQSISSHPIYLRCILILYSHLHLGLPRGLFLTKTLYAFFFTSMPTTCPSSLCLY
jgi:hypothetical protein